MNRDNVIPVGDRYLIETYKAADESSTGLSMENQNNTANAPVIGTVLKAGDKGTFKVGEMVLFRRYSIDELKFINADGEQIVHIVEGSEIIATMGSNQSK